MAQKHSIDSKEYPMTREGRIQGPSRRYRRLRHPSFAASIWASKNPLLQRGEIGYEIDTHKVKIGDGVTYWNDLSYIDAAGAEWGEIGGDIADQTDLTQYVTDAVDTKVSKTGDDMSGPIVFTGITDNVLQTTPIIQIQKTGSTVTEDAFKISMWGSTPAMYLEGNVYGSSFVAPTLASSAQKAKAYIHTINNGNNITVPTTSGTMLVADFTGATEGKQLLLDSNLKPVWGEASTYLTYPASWTTTGTTKAFCDDIAADSSATVGRAYLGEVTLSDMPSGIGNAEIKVYILDGTTAANKVIELELTSGNVAPYKWQYVYWNGGSNVSGWKTWQEPLVSGTNIKTVNSTSLLGFGDITIDGLPTQTGNSGKLLKTDGTSASWTEIKTINSGSILGSGNIDVLVNEATATNALGVGYTTINTTYNDSINIGNASQVLANNAIALGAFASAEGQDSIAIYSSTGTAHRARTTHTGNIAIGYNAMAINAAYTIAIGYNAYAQGTNSIQLGTGQVALQNTFQVWTYPILNKTTGLIPSARLADQTSATQGQALILDANLDAQWTTIPTGGFDLFDHKWRDATTSNTAWALSDGNWKTNATALAHLIMDYESTKLYAWGNSGNYVYTKTPNEGVHDGDNVYDATGTAIDTVAWHSLGPSIHTTTGDTTYVRDDTADINLSQTETIAGITITYYRADDGHKIILPDQETNANAIYTATGVAWYYILDEANSQFKLPRVNPDVEKVKVSAPVNFASTDTIDITSAQNPTKWTKSDGTGHQSGSTNLAAAGTSGDSIAGASQSTNYGELTISNAYADISNGVGYYAGKQYLYFYVG